jgi:F-type H+-transporting ATPase subunit epsilon
VVSFVGSDASGSFGILGGREPFATTVSWGICRLRMADQVVWRYLALPGGVLSFASGRLHIAARRYFLDDDPERIVKTLTEQMRAEDQRTRDVHELLRDLDRELMRRLLAR